MKKKRKEAQFPAVQSSEAYAKIYLSIIHRITLNVKSSFQLSPPRHE